MLINTQSSDKERQGRQTDTKHGVDVIAYFYYHCFITLIKLFYFQIILLSLIILIEV